MTQQWTFLTDAEGWISPGSGDPANWDTVIYHNLAGAIYSNYTWEGADTVSHTLDTPETVGELSFWYYIDSGGYEGNDLDTLISITVQYTDTSETAGSVTWPIDSANSGWLKTTLTLDAKDVAKIVLTSSFLAAPSGSGAGVVYFDEVTIGAAADTGFRLLGLAVDNGNLYTTDVYDSTLRLVTYDKATLTASGTATFGTCDYAAPDDGTGGLYPLARPGADNELYAYGLDGSANQINYKSGTLDWSNISPGTAVWDGNFCAALLPDALAPDDIIAVPYNDDDIQRTTTAGDDWASAGNAGQEITGGVRYPTRPDELLLAGAAAGTLFYSPNNGASLNNVGGTALGTINWIEVNR